MCTAPRRILLLEDDPLISNLFGSVLKRAGYEVSAATSGRDALRCGQTYSEEIELTIADVVLKDEAAYPVVGRLRELMPHMRVLFVSGFPFDILVESGWLDPAPFE